MTTPICKDCKHVEAGVSPRCLRKPSTTYRDLVDGDVMLFYPRATDQRHALMPWKCGAKGRFFEAKA